MAIGSVGSRQAVGMQAHGLVAGTKHDFAKFGPTDRPWAEYNSLQQLSGITIYGQLGRNRVGIVHADFTKKTGPEFVAKLYKSSKSQSEVFDLNISERLALATALDRYLTVARIPGQDVRLYRSFIDGLRGPVAQG